jgi:hypothetical protein
LMKKALAFLSLLLGGNLSFASKCGPSSHFFR